MTEAPVQGTRWSRTSLAPHRHRPAACWGPPPQPRPPPAPQIPSPSSPTSLYVCLQHSSLASSAHGPRVAGVAAAAGHTYAKKKKAHADHARDWTESHSKSFHARKNNPKKSESGAQRHAPRRSALRCSRAHGPQRARLPDIRHAAAIDSHAAAADGKQARAVAAALQQHGLVFPVCVDAELADLRSHGSVRLPHRPALANFGDASPRSLPAARQLRATHHRRNVCRAARWQPRGQSRGWHLWPIHS